MICNATPLICLAKMNQLELLKKLFRQIIIPSAVVEEIIKESKPGFDNITRFLEEDWIQIKEVKVNRKIGLGKGENAVINLAIEMQDTVILDDAQAITAAKAFKLTTIRTTTVLFMGLEKRYLTREETINLFNKLIENGYYISPKYYALILTKLKS